MLQPFRTPIHAKRTYRELQLLIHLNHPDAQVCRNYLFIYFHFFLFEYFTLKVVQLLNVFTPDKNLNDFQSVYVD